MPADSTPAARRFRDPSEEDAVTGAVADAASAADLRAAVLRAAAAAAAVRGGPERTARASARWSAVLRGSVAAAVRLTPGADTGTWLVSGSVGRGEATLGSDVETLLVLPDDASEADKTRALRRAAEVHALLERCGVRGDANGVTGSRPRFARRLASWTEGIEQWSQEPHRDRGVVMVGVLSDSTAASGAATGDSGCTARLQSRVTAAAGANYPVRRAMLQDATAVRMAFPSRLRLLATGLDSVDVKIAVLDPLVKTARWGALSAGSTAVFTPTRLDAAAAAGFLRPGDAAGLRDCHAWLSRLRWQLRSGHEAGHGPTSDVVTLSRLAPQERSTLRSIAREVSGVGRRLAYLASTGEFHRQPEPA